MTRPQEHTRHRGSIADTGLELTELGFGGSVIGNLYRVSPDEDAAAALDDVLPTAREHGKSVVAAGVFNSGLLARDRPAQGMTYDYRAAPAHILERARAIAEVCEWHGSSLRAAAVAFPFTHPAVANVTLGMGTAAHVLQNVDLHRQAPPPALWTDLRARGLLRGDVPV